MSTKRVFITYKEFDSSQELDSPDLNLLHSAENALTGAYAPYSNFKVGAAILLDNGKIVVGNNQENMAFPSGLCAERVAIFAASSINPGIAINSIAITAKSGDFTVDEPVTPCGACRQTLIEYENIQGRPIRVILGSESGKVIILDSIADLLPLSFRGERLRKG